MMENSNWNEVKLGDISDIISKKTPIENATLENYISTENMINDFGGVQNAEKLPTTNTVNAFVENDILFSNIRTYFKKVWHAKFDGTVSQDVLTFRAKENIISKFLYYTLCNPEFTEYTVLTSKGAKMPRGDKDAIRNFEIQLPPLPEQKAIASVLSSLDDKIDLLHQQNQTLEALAETLFRQWFIEEAKEDWEEVKLGEICLIKAGGDKPKNFSDIKTKELNIPIYSNGISNKGLYGYTDQAKIYEECITISARGTIGFVCLRKTPFVPIVRLISIIPKNKVFTANYLYLWTKSQNILGTGSTQEQLTVPDISDFNITIPHKIKLDKFSKIVDVLFNKIDSNELQIQTLTQLRDTLLPKLMSGAMSLSNCGEVRVTV